MKVLVCGSRTWTDEDAIQAALAKLPNDTTIIHGGAKGADSMADDIARKLGLTVHVYLANWKSFGRAAGPIRNQLMLDTEHPDLVLAFQVDHSRGTQDMIIRARARGITTKVHRVNSHK